MYRPPEANALDRVYERSVPVFSPFSSGEKEHRKPVRWYTQLTVYGNPGRVVNGYAPGIPVLICSFVVVVCGGGCGEVVEGTVLVLVPLTMGGAGRRIFPPRLRRGTRHPDAPPLLAPHRRAPGLTP